MKTPRNREELRDVVRQYAPGSQDHTVRVPGGRVSTTGRLSSTHHVEFESEDGLEAIDFHEHASCDFGHLQGDDVQFVGTCTICGRYVCDRESCARECARGHLVCGPHSLDFNDKTWCRRHAVGAVAAAAAVSTLKAAGRGVAWVVQGFFRSYGTGG